MPHGQRVEFRAGAGGRNQYFLVAGGFVVVAVMVVGGRIPLPAPWRLVFLLPVAMSFIAAVVISFIAASRGVALDREGLTVRGFHGYATPDGMPALLVRGFWTTRRYPWSQIKSITGQRFYGDVTVVQLLDGTRVRTWAPISHWMGRDRDYHRKLAVLQQWHAHFAEPGSANRAPHGPRGPGV